jgi:hypothetical protein
MGQLVRDDNSQRIQAFCPLPAKVQAPINLNGTKLLKKRPTAGEIAGGVIDITGWMAVNIIPSVSNITRYFNADTTKTRTIFAGQDNILVIHPNVTTITLTGVDASVEIEGM